MNNFKFSIKSIGFDENYQPADNTRITTNFANLARGERRQQNLRNTLAMINNRFNSLVFWDNPNSDRYSVQLDIISVAIQIEGTSESSDHNFPAIEVLKTTIIDSKTNQRIEGIVGNNFSSYVRDYDFSLVLAEHNKNQPKLQHSGSVWRSAWQTLSIFCQFRSLPATFSQTTSDLPECVRQQNLSAHRQSASGVRSGVSAE